jgi:hypothetical protein
MSEQTPLLLTKHSKLKEQISADASLFPLCLLVACTGLINWSSYSATRIWPGFLTGQTCQLGAALPGFLQTGRVNTEEWLPLTSLLSFGSGAFLGGSLNRRLGAATRAAYGVRTTVQVVAILTVAILLLTSPNGRADWNDVSGFL